MTLNVKTEGLEPELKRVAKLIYEGNLEQGQIDPGMVKKIAKQLFKTFSDGYGKDFDREGLSAEERTFVEQVKKNIYTFSGFKNHAELKEANGLLLDGKGGYKDFNSFFQDIKQIDETYNELYAQAEHGNAIASGQSAATWHSYQRNGISVITFITAGDNRVRSEHAAYDGLTLNINDPFWDTHMTPLGWGCRCDTQPGDEEDVIPIDDFVDRQRQSGVLGKNENLPSIPRLFQTNVGKTGDVFSKDHPYFDVDKKTAAIINKQVADILPESKSNFIPANLSEYESKMDVKIDKGVFDYLSKDTELSLKRGGSHYAPHLNKVNLDISKLKTQSKYSSEAVVYHEFGHAADEQNGFTKLPVVNNTMKSAIKKYSVEFGKISEDLMRRHHSTSDMGVRAQVTKVADTIMSLNTNYGWGHTKTYFRRPGNKQAEFIAHAFENKFIGNEVFKQVMPDLFDEMVSMVDSFKNHVL